MTAITKRTVSVTAEQDKYIESSVASGEYASASEVVRAGLRALQERDRAMNEWLRREAVPVMERLLEHPEEAIPAREVFDDLRRLHAERTTKTGR
ncbi:type II toxin-antitoxin system ParD family antitoxin [Pelagibacterium xiamenense]|uniref:type II toxin-antitoxin system ParD family antitoxin n=1 Tax=Pelagibacterium xiamenense TaxID=2901140 RepID=UPI001E288501|nr:type II toxin-antitoxin system ParD family antitoxin [Pelagibacterium xiamenense]MCD7059772.1 type II toxin-antitoxin system ParD family antitoxin [Pelagibacterium xiamenense]